MNKKEANRIAKSKWGPFAVAERGNDTFDRRSRYRLGFMTFKNGGRAVQVVGIGDSYEAAFKMADTNIAAVEQEKTMAQIGLDLREMAEDPEGYKARMVKEAEELNLKMAEAIKESQNEESQRSVVAGNPGEPAGIEGHDDGQAGGQLPSGDGGGV